jgi:hypothetical protein
MPGGQEWDWTKNGDKTSWRVPDHVPLSIRYDINEKVHGEPFPHLFARRVPLPALARRSTASSIWTSSGLIGMSRSQSVRVPVVGAL